MVARVGIELSPSACRVVEIRGAATSRHASDTRVESFAILPPDGLEARATFEALRGRDAAVVVWGARTDHRQVVVAGGSYEAMRREAIAALGTAGIDTRGTIADIAPAARGNDRSKRRPVVVALADVATITNALAPILEAGVKVRSVLTPAAALASLARTRRASAVPNAIEAYVALDESATCIALVRDGALLGARELAWGFIDEHRHQRDDVTERLGEELSDFFAAIGASSGAIGQVCICGGLPELRSMTLPLVERLDVEVEPLDSLYAIDAAHLPGGADAFRDRSAELRVAWAAAADWPPAINLLRARTRQAAKTLLSRAAVIAGVAAGLGLGWRIQQTTWWQSTRATPVSSTASATRTSKPPSTGSATSTRAQRTPTQPASEIARATPPRTTAPALPAKPVVTPAPPPPTSNAVASVLPAPSSPASSSSARLPSSPVSVPRPVPRPPEPEHLAPPHAPTSPPDTPASLRAAAKPTETTATASPPRAARPIDTPPSPARILPPSPTIPPRVAGERPQLLAPAQPFTPTVSPSRPPAPENSASRAPEGSGSGGSQPITGVPAAPPRMPKPVPAEVALPFDANLATILYSADRKLAIVDGRIVGVGEEVRGARVIDIAPNAVSLRDAQGRLRRITLGATGR